MKEYGPKNPPPSSPGVELEPPYLVISKNEILGVFRLFIQRSLCNIWMVPKLSNDLHNCLQSFARFCQICMNTFEKGYKQCEKQEVLLIHNSVSPFFLFLQWQLFTWVKKGQSIRASAIFSCFSTEKEIFINTRGRNFWTIVSYHILEHI